MLGLGAGIDYALFVVTRFRQYLTDGIDAPAAAAKANATAGVSILFAGGTVVVAILGLNAAGIPFVGAMGLASALVVAVMVLAAVTLLPALLGLAGTKVDSVALPGLGHNRRRLHYTVASGRLTRTRAPHRGTAAGCAVAATRWTSWPWPSTTPTGSAETR